MNDAILLILLAIGITGCQAIAGDDVPVTLSSEMTAFVTEVSMIQQAADVEQTVAIETLEASGTNIANASNVNAVLASTVQSNVIPTPSIRQVIVNPADMGSSLDTEMMEDDTMVDGSGETQVRNLGIARSVRTSDGCSNGNVTQFTNDDERIYFTAEIVGLRDGTTFSVDWIYEERVVDRSVWTADYSASFECIWFYITQDDVSFLPGLYTVTMYMGDMVQPSQQFSINTG